MLDPGVVTNKDVDLSNCDREQIQFPAATLAHGFLLALKEPELTVIQAGVNAPDFLGGTLDLLIGAPIEIHLDAALAGSLRDCVRRLAADGPPVRVGTALLSGKEMDVFVHRCDGSLIVEFESRPDKLACPVNDPYPKVHAAIARLQHETTLQSFLDLAVSEVRRLTGFDRVMAYQFLEDGSGAVRAESVVEGYEPFLGLHYPASDIPLPSRRLFKVTWLRHQPNIDYTPVPIVPESNPFTGQPLNLSYALLRSVSVMYSQYLKNMGTRASMVLTLLKNGELWGLIACHHHSGPRHIPFESRAACEFLIHMASLLLAAKEDQEDHDYRMRLKDFQSHVAAALARKPDLLAVLVDQRPGLLDFIDAGGAALVTDGRPTLLGETPEPEQVQRLAGWLAAERAEDVFVSDGLSAVLPEAAAYKHAASGLLAVRTGAGANGYVLWFRPELQRTVNWAGDPRKPVDVSEDGERLLPRSSFAIWKEAVEAKSRLWKAVEVKAARELRQAFVECAARRADQLNLLNEDLNRANAELDAFAYIASHDLKEPLRGIHNYTQFLMEDFGNTLPEEAADQLRTVIRLTRRMDDLLDSLLRYSRIGRQGMDTELCDLNQLIAEVIETLAPRIQEQQAQILVPEPLPPVQADFARLSEVFMNLISNAIKYNDKPQKLVEIGCVQVRGATTFFVRDNGIGIAPEYHESIFAIFRRLHPPGRFGGGTGAGLTIARKIIERHGGSIWVESSPGNGTTFHFTIGTN